MNYQLDKLCDGDLWECYQTVHISISQSTHITWLVHMNNQSEKPCDG